MNSFFGKNVNNLDLVLCIMESGVANNNLLRKGGRIYISVDLVDHLLNVKRAYV